MSRAESSFLSEASYIYLAERTKYRGSRTVADMCYWLLSFTAERIFFPRDIMCKVVMQATSSLVSRPSC
ncbi:Ribosomal lysine N-methyltransferase 4 [Fusarium oxysporum f. sp. albedinis]|nr:Ribosomal lysine N-methyltransferase 4 [Fusarium oxysporum f. sp. albedinis]